MADWASERYLSLTTFRRDGSAVATPVWIAELPDGRLAFTTDPTSWKVKRLRRNNSIEVRPCSMRGAVAPDAPVGVGTAEIVTDAADYAPVVAALKKKYGVQVTLIEIGGRLKQMIKRTPNPDCALILTLT